MKVFRFLVYVHACVCVCIELGARKEAIILGKPTDERSDHLNIDSYAILRCFETGTVTRSSRVSTT